MFTNDVHAEVKRLTKELKTTQASLVNALVQFALDNCDPTELALEPAKKRGRKPGSKNAAPAVAVAAEPVEVELDTPTELAETINAPFQATV